LEQTIAEVQARDAADSEREHAPLRQAADAVGIDTTRLAIDQVLAEMLAVVRQRQVAMSDAAENTAARRGA
jgi:cytidylate kinase